MTIYERIKKLRIQLGMSQAELAKKVGYEGRSAISKVEKGERDISQSMIMQYAQALNVSPTYLLYGDDYENQSVGVSAEIFDHISNLHPVEAQRIPMLGRIACGKPIYAEEEHECYVAAGTKMDADFCLTCQGDSMTGAGIHDGDIVFIRQQEAVDNGQVAAIIIGDEATLKRVYYFPETAKLVLQAENPKYEPLVYTGEELNGIKILGRAVAYMSAIV